MPLNSAIVWLVITLLHILQSSYGQLVFPGPYPQVVLPPYPGGRGLPFLPLPPPFIPSLPQLYPTYVRAGGLQAPRLDQNQQQQLATMNQGSALFNGTDQQPGGIPVKFPGLFGLINNRNDTNKRNTNGSLTAGDVNSVNGNNVALTETTKRIVSEVTRRLVAEAAINIMNEGNLQQKRVDNSNAIGINMNNPNNKQPSDPSTGRKGVERNNYSGNPSAINADTRAGANAHKDVRINDGPLSSLTPLEIALRKFNSQMGPIQRLKAIETATAKGKAAQETENGIKAVGKEQNSVENTASASRISHVKQKSVQGVNGIAQPNRPTPRSEQNRRNAINAQRTQDQHNNPANAMRRQTDKHAVKAEPNLQTRLIKGARNRNFVQDRSPSKTRYQRLENMQVHNQGVDGTKNQQFRRINSGNVNVIQARNQNVRNTVPPPDHSNHVPNPKLRRIYVFRFNKNQHHQHTPMSANSREVYRGNRGQYNVPRVVVRPSYTSQPLPSNKKREVYQQKTSIRRLTAADRTDNLKKPPPIRKSVTELPLPFERLSLKYPKFLKSQREGKRKKSFKHINFKTDLETGRIKIKRPPGFELMNEVAKTNSVPTADNVQITRTDSHSTSSSGTNGSSKQGNTNTMTKNQDKSGNKANIKGNTKGGANDTTLNLANKNKLIEEIGNFIDLAQKLNIDLSKLLHEEKKKTLQSVKNKSKKTSGIAPPPRAEAKAIGDTKTNPVQPVSKFIFLRKQQQRGVKLK